MRESQREVVRLFGRWVLWTRTFEENGGPMADYLDDEDKRGLAKKMMEVAGVKPVRKVEVPQSEEEAAAGLGALFG